MVAVKKGDTIRLSSDFKDKDATNEGNATKVDATSAIMLLGPIILQEFKVDLRMTVVSLKILKQGIY